MSLLATDTARLVRLADRDLSRLWQLVANGASADVALRDLLPAIIEQYGAAGAAMAAEWYDDQREKAGVGGRFTAIPTPAPTTSASRILVWSFIPVPVLPIDSAIYSSNWIGGRPRRSRECR